MLAEAQNAESGLEIITGELNHLIVEALVDDFYNGLANAFDDIMDKADEMRESVEDEQLFVAVIKFLVLA